MLRVLHEGVDRRQTIDEAAGLGVDMVQFIGGEPTLHPALPSGSQVICATHSPLLAALPEAQILELGDHGIRTVRWNELELVDHWRRFLTQPDAYLRHLINNQET